MTTGFMWLLAAALVLAAAAYLWFRMRNDAQAAAATASGEHGYEDHTYDELYEIAKERDLSGRSTMKKDELIDALREQGG